MKHTRLLGVLLLGALLVSACGPSEAEELATQDALRTLAVSTVNAQFTQDALLNPSATFTLPPSNTPAPTVTLSPTATATTGSTGSGGTGTGGTGTGGTSGGAFPTSDSCDFMAFIGDVNIPDGTTMSAGQSFTKTWRVQNNGTCTWTTSYTVAFDSGDQMAGNNSQNITKSVAPGETLDISVNLNAPASAGTYRGYWVLKNADGFAIGSFYVEIVVQ